MIECLCGCWAEIKADEKGIDDFGGEILRLKQRKEFLESRIVENKAWAANYDEKFGPFVNKYKEFMAQVSYPHACEPVGLLVYFLCVVFSSPVMVPRRARWLCDCLVISDGGALPERQGQTYRRSGDVEEALWLPPRVQAVVWHL